MNNQPRETKRRRRRGFTLVELVAVMVVLAILSIVAIPRFFNHGAEAAERADEASLDAIRTAFNLAQIDHRVNGAPPGQWITDVAQIASVMETRALPNGLRIDGDRLIDVRGNEYALTPETASEPARLELVEAAGGPGGGPGGGGSANPNGS